MNFHLCTYIKGVREVCFEVCVCLACSYEFGGGERKLFLLLRAECEGEGF